jgi:uncharacterized membrane protein
LTRTGFRTIIVVAALVVIAACLATVVALVASSERPAQKGGAVLVGAGDIAKCLSSADNATAELLDAIPGTVFTVGDNVCPSGTAWRFVFCYGPTWGRHKAHQTSPRQPRVPHLGGCHRLLRVLRLRGWPAIQGLLLLRQGRLARGGARQQL